MAFISFGLFFFLSIADVPEVSIYLGYGLACIHFDLFDQTNFSHMLIKVLICTFDLYRKKKTILFQISDHMNSKQPTDKHIQGPVNWAKNFFE